MPARDYDRWQQNEDGSWSRSAPDLDANPQAYEADDVKATQGAIEYAEEHGIDLASIQGTGKDGQITKADVEAAPA